MTSIQGQFGGKKDCQGKSASNDAGLSCLEKTKVLMCPPGQILRESYERKDHARIPAACVEDRGKPGKTPESQKILPKPGDEIHLSTYGYTTKGSEESRHHALKKASQDNGMLKVYRRLVLLYNLQADENDNRAKHVMKKDVKYMKRLYATHKMKEGRGSKSRSRSRHDSKRGGSRKGSRKSSRKSSRKHSKKH